MTKAREPSTFEDAIIRIVDRIGWADAAKAVGWGEKVVRNWSDPDMDRKPSIEEAFALDAAYLAAGGGNPPIATVYALRLDREAGPRVDTRELARCTARAARDAGEALAAVTIALQPGSSERERATADHDTSKAIEALGEVHRKLGGKATKPALKAV